MAAMYRLVVAVCFAIADLGAWLVMPLPTPVAPIPLPYIVDRESSPGDPYHLLYAYVTGYNTVVGQTDDQPCIAATGDNICGRHNVVACPRSLPLGTVVEISGKPYLCEDRTARKFDGRFDISCDKDRNCPMKIAGWTTVKVFED